MSFRSRTLLFLSFRDSTTRSPRQSRHQASHYPDPDDDEHVRLIDSDQPSGSSLPPKWVDSFDQVQDLLSHISAQIQTLDKLHAKHVLPGFTDKTAEEREIEELTNQITRAFRRCHALIQSVGPDKAHKFPPNASTSHHEVLTSQNVQRGLAAKLQDISSSFRKKQRIYFEKLQGHSIKKQDILLASGAISLKGSESLAAVEEDMDAAFHSQAQALSEPDLQARDKELREIAKSIGSLAELFRDLSTLVIDQGTILDSVEYNMENTTIHMQEAVKELDIATRYQKNTGRRKCIFLLMLIIFGLILVIIFKPRRSKADVKPPTTPTATSAVR